MQGPGRFSTSTPQAENSDIIPEGRYGHGLENKIEQLEKKSGASQLHPRVGAVARYSTSTSRSGTKDFQQIAEKDEEKFVFLATSFEKP